MYKIEGKVTQVFPEQSGVGKSGREWVKRGFIVMVHEEVGDKTYDTPHYITAWGNSAREITDKLVGQDCSVMLNVRSSEYKGRWGTDLGLIAAEFPGIYNDERFNDESFEDTGND